MTPPTDDRGFMTAALTLARRGLGQVAPNPAVGCLLVRDGRIVARGWTQPGGRPHAESEALRRAGAAARGATAYVTLEPCAHRGKTPPCANALIDAGIARCVVATEDPHRRVAGAGIARLRAAGITVEVGLLREQAEALNAGFLLVQNQGRPLVTLKLATSIDGRIATAAGESKWITGPEARARAHLLRAQHDAVLVGSGTAVADNPRLDVRLPGLDARKPVRIVLDGRLRLPLTHDLVRRAGEHPTWMLTRDDNDPSRLRLFRRAGVEVVTVTTDAAGVLDLAACLRALAERGLTRVLVEGGGHIAAGLLRIGAVDRLAWFRGSVILGADGHPATATFGLERLADAPGFRRLSIDIIDQDVLETYARKV